MYDVEFTRGDVSWPAAANTRRKFDRIDALVVQCAASGAASQRSRLLPSQCCGGESFSEIWISPCSAAAPASSCDDMFAHRCHCGTRRRNYVEGAFESDPRLRAPSWSPAKSMYWSMTSRTTGATLARLRACTRLRANAPRIRAATLALDVHRSVNAWLATIGGR
jgi:hypothetical protein